MSKLSIQTNDESVQIICKRDPTMKKLVTAIGDIEVSLRTDYFSSIVRSIIGQQISVAAAVAIYGRLQGLLGGIVTLEGLLTKSHEELREVGLTKRKTEYLKDLADKVRTNELDLDNIKKYDDAEIMKQLINVKGIGKWTAEMFLILTLGRKDILAIDDVALQRAAKWLYDTEKSERRNILIEKIPLWKPYCSVVSFYLWEAIHLGLIADYDSIDDLVNKNV